MEKKISEVWTVWADITPLYEEELYWKIYQSVPEFRQKKADRLHFQVDRALSVGAWWLLMQARELYHATDNSVFNLSHSGKYALCSIGPEQEKVGCDVEMIGKFHEGLAERFFCPKEVERIGKDEAKQAETFYRYWVLKESFMKATRKGMALGLDTFEIELPDGAAPRLIRQPEEIQEHFYFLEAKVEENDASIAVCSTSDKIRMPEKIELPFKM